VKFDDRRGALFALQIAVVKRQGGQVNNLDDHAGRGQVRRGAQEAAVVGLGAQTAGKGGYGDGRGHENDSRVCEATG